LTIDVPASSGPAATIQNLAVGDTISLIGPGFSSPTNTLSYSNFSQSYFYNVAGAQSGTMLDILAFDKVIVVPTSAVFMTDSLQHSFSLTSPIFYILANDTISGAGSGFLVTSTDASTNVTYSVVINQSSSISVTGAGVGVGVTTTNGANAAVVNAGGISSGGTGINTSSGAGSTDIVDYGNVAGAQYAIFAASTSGKLNIFQGNGTTLTSTNSYGVFARTTGGDINVTTMFGAINSGSAGILAQEQWAGSAGTGGSITVLNSAAINSGGFAINSGAAAVGPANGSAGIRAGILNGTTTTPNASIVGNVYVEDRANITAATGSGIMAFNYGSGNTTVSLGSGAQIQATAANTTASGFSQYGIFAFNYGIGSSTATTGWGTTINSGSTAINVGNQATVIAQDSGSSVTVMAQGTINSGANNNNSGSAPSGIQAGYNPGNAGVFNGNVFGDVFVSLYGDGSANGHLTAAAGDGINSYNYGVGNITVMLGSNVSIQALTAATSSTSGNAPYGIGVLNRGPGSITVATSSLDNIQSGSTGINAVNEATTIAAAAGATVAVTTGGIIHSRSLPNNSNNQPSGIAAGFLGGNSSTPNLNVNGTVIVNNAAAITADAGVGINAYNYGNGNITVNDAGGGNITSVAQGIYAHAEGAGSGDIAVNVYANASIASSASYGILAFSTNNGSISVITSAGDGINSAGAGINVVNEAVATSTNTSVVVTAAGTINSGTTLTGFNNQPSGITAGYIGGTTNPSPQNLANYNVNGEVVINNSATINAAAGYGVQGYTYGTGDVYVNNFGVSITSLGGASPPNGSGIGILAQTYGPGSVHVTTTAGTFISSGGSGIAAINKATTISPVDSTTVVPIDSEISVVANGTIHSGTIPTATIANDPPAGILAGYNPGNQNTANDNVHGKVWIDDHATIVAPTGTDGIRAVNYGTGDIAIVIESDADIMAGRYGVAGLGANNGNVSITNDGSVIGGSAALNASTTGAGTVTIDNVGFLGGLVTAYDVTFTNEHGADWQFSGASVFSGTSTLSNAGTIESTGTASLTGLSGLTNSGTIAVESGSLTINAPVTGGVAVVYSASLVLNGASDTAVSFDAGASAPSVLVLSAVAHFTGTVTGFAFGDTIDLIGISPASVSVSNSGGLHVDYSAGSFGLLGNYNPSGFSVVSDGSGGTDIIWNHQVPTFDTHQLSMTHNSDGSTTINGLLVTDADNGASSETFGVSLTTNPSLTSGSLSAINTALASGMTYSPGATPPATATVTLSISDVPGATETVNFVFNQAGTGQNIPVQGTSGNDVIFATTFQDVLTGAGGQDQFVFTPVSSGSVTHTVTDFTLGIDKLDLRQFSNVSASSLPVEAQLGNDTLITLDASDTILLKNVVATNLHASDFIMHT
jgi:hypothetical protein